MLIGTTKYVPGNVTRERGERTTTRRTLVISGALNPSKIANQNIASIGYEGNGHQALLCRGRDTLCTSAIAKYQSMTAEWEAELGISAQIKEM